MLKGSIVALVTPMHDNGAIDEQNLAALVQWHLDSGTDGFVIAGTTGESPTLTSDETIHLFELVAKQVAGKVPVFAGTGCNNTAKTIETSIAAKATGIDGLLLVTPYYNKPTQQGLLEHFTYIAETVDLPQILYNVPHRTQCDLLPSTVAELAKQNNIIGIKDASDELDRCKQLVSACPDGFIVLSGDDPTALRYIQQGARGVISVVANVAPRLMHELCQAALTDDNATALLIEQKLSGLYKQLFVESNPIPIKWALYEMGKIAQGIRLPLTVLSEQYRAALREALQTTLALG